MIPRVSYILPTRNRPEALAHTLRALGSLPPHDAEVVVVDNASDPPATVPAILANDLPVIALRRDHNHGAAARNDGVSASDRGTGWIVMLDDDSCPTDLEFLEPLAEADRDVLAISADIHLPAMHRRESGGLPEVFIGCGVAIRRGAFIDAGGYDPSFHYYAEEYDLAARLLLAGGRVVFEPRFRVLHQKVLSGRDMGMILGRLVRNNGWVLQRYAPASLRRAELALMRGRYRGIAEKESAIAGYGHGLAELRSTIRHQRRTPMPDALWDRFTGLAHARAALQRAWRTRPFRSAAIIAPGKNAHLVEQAVRDLGAVIAQDPRHAQALVIGTLSPGPLLDALEESRDERTIAPWTIRPSGAPLRRAS